MTEKEMAQYLSLIVMGIVDEPSSVIVVPKMGEQTLVLEVSTARTDVGKVVGKKGSMAHALRTIVKAIAAKHQMRVVMDIMD